MRLLLDTNILVSGLISPNGAPGRLVRAWLDDRFELVTAVEQIDELRRVVAHGHLAPYISAGQSRDLVENIDVKAIVVSALPVLDVSPDPDDNRILAIAVAGDVDAIVSGDKSDVLALGDVQGIPVITAREAVSRLGL